MILELGLLGWGGPLGGGGGFEWDFAMRCEHEGIVYPTHHRILPDLSAFWISEKAAPMMTGSTYYMAGGERSGSVGV